NVFQWRWGPTPNAFSLNCRRALSAPATQALRGRLRRGWSTRIIPGSRGHDTAYETNLRPADVTGGPCRPRYRVRNARGISVQTHHHDRAVDGGRRHRYGGARDGHADGARA